MKEIEQGQMGFVGTSAIIVVLILAATVMGLIWYVGQNNKVDVGGDQSGGEPIGINSFDECAAAGYPVAESYPQQCFVPNGPSFTEIVTDDTGSLSDFRSEKGKVLKLKGFAGNIAISSPLTITGEVRGSWSFEADFPIEVTDSHGNTVAESHGTLQGDWMTDEYVPFEANLTFDRPDTDTGFLILHRDNPSGLTENDDFVRIPIRFESQ